MRLAAKIVLAVVALLLILVFIVPCFLPWSGLHSRYEWMDITSGRCRNQRYVLFVKVTDRVEETRVSQLYRELVGEPGEPEWRLCNTFGPYVAVSPHHAYHSAMAGARMLLKTFEHTPFTDGAKRKALLTYLDLLQQHDSYDPADDYVDRVICHVARLDKDLVDADDLPPAEKAP